MGWRQSLPRYGEWPLCNTCERAEASIWSQLEVHWIHNTARLETKSAHRDPLGSELWEYSQEHWKITVSIYLQEGQPRPTATVFALKNWLILGKAQNHSFPGKRDGAKSRYCPENLPTWGICVSNLYWSGNFKVWLIWGWRIFHVLLSLANRNREIISGNNKKAAQLKVWYQISVGGQEPSEAPVSSCCPANFSNHPISSCLSGPSAVDVTKRMPGLTGIAGAQVEEEVGEAGIERETSVHASKGNLPAVSGVFKTHLFG